MANAEALEFLQRCLSGYGGAAEWNNYRAQVGPQDLAQADLQKADLKGYNFTKCNLAAAKLFNADLDGADLSEAFLSYADLRRANLAHAYLSGSNLQVAQLQGANLVDATLERADLKSARCGGAYLVGANLSGADLSNADLRGANMKYATLTGAKLDAANVEDADLTGVKLDKQQTAAVRYLERAIIRHKPAAHAAAEEKKKLASGSYLDDLFVEEDCYKILGVSREASLEDLDHAYKQRIKEYHPDRVNHLGEKLKIVAEREFQRIQTAYKSLTLHRSKPVVRLHESTVSKAQIPQKPAKDYTIDDYLTIIKAQPTNDAAYYNLGIKYFENGLVDLAIQSYQKAIVLNPQNQAARHNLKLAELAKSLGR